MPPRNIVMSAFRRRSIEANLFPAALAAVEPWERFRWHGASGDGCDTYKEKSSQALSIDVFGTLQQSAERDVVLDQLAAGLGLPMGGPWDLKLEWRDPHNLLKEKQRTWVDAVARSPRSLIFFECKFCETDGGGCGQTQPILAGRRKGFKQCNGCATLPPAWRSRERPSCNRLLSWSTPTRWPCRWPSVSEGLSGGA